METQNENGGMKTNSFYLFQIEIPFFHDSLSSFSMLEKGKTTFGHGGRGVGCHENCQLGQTAALVKVRLVSETVLLLIVENISN